ncbi:FtsW/RodA/SpoVE family cell cycle protein [Lentibacillus sp. L22]|uniref:FtsW/RodA/SpoVE family cell cycle protein n=1 Tax=Lentibacillus TaxID=175304 RepID=UPI0022B16F5D|nr:FtsW/RodA/SpoVE family cell cycle protein [Lentibacillus daqui]
MNSLSNRPNIDYTLIFIIILLGCVSLFTIYTIVPSLPASYDGSHFVFKQFAWYIAGGILVAFIMLLDYDRFKQITWILYGIGLVSLLMLTLRFPAPIIHEANNAVSWFKFPGIGTVQPSEFMKIFLVLAVSLVVAQHNEKYRTKKNIKSDLWLLLKILIVALPPMLLIATEPDLGGFLVLSFITASIVLVSGISWRIIFSILGAAVGIVAAGVAAWYFFPGPVADFLEDSVFGHVSSRIYGWLDPEQYPDSGYQLILAMLAIGSGQLFGKGISNLEVYVPERHTDMIFTAISEQFGFIGASLVVALFFVFIYRLIHIALMSNDSYGSYLVTGLVGMFSYQVFQNIGMSIQLLPVTGLPLPFLSYGGSSTLAYMMAVGIVLNVHSRTRQYMFQ